MPRYNNPNANPKASPATRSSNVQAILGLFCLGLVLMAGVSDSQAQADPDVIINKSIEAHGGEAYWQNDISFDFRDKSYRYVPRSKWYWTYFSNYFSNAGPVQEEYRGGRISQSIGGELVPLTAKESFDLETRINSVVYFALLPFGLDNSSIFRKYLGEKTVKGVAYHKVEVTFQLEGGGRDWEDRFVYWINKDTYIIDYLAYSYKVNGGGTRFRIAKNARKVGGIHFQDYGNYTADPVIKDVAKYDEYFEQGKLKFFSDIETENITVSPKQ